MVAIASFYVVFVVQKGNAETIMIQSVVAVGFTALAIAASRWNVWLLITGLAGHSLFDTGLGGLSTNSVPDLCARFCLANDLTMGIGLATPTLLVQIKPAR